MDPYGLPATRQVTHICGPSTTDGQIHKVRVVSEGSDTTNFAFDVTPARLITGFITERGICSASEEGLLSLFPEKRRS